MEIVVYRVQKNAWWLYKAITETAYKTNSVYISVNHIVQYVQTRAHTQTDNYKIVFAFDEFTILQ